MKPRPSPWHDLRLLGGAFLKAPVHPRRATSTLRPLPGPVCLSMYCSVPRRGPVTLSPRRMHRGPSCRLEWGSRLGQLEIVTSLHPALVVSSSCPLPAVALRCPWFFLPPPPSHITRGPQTKASWDTPAPRHPSPAAGRGFCFLGSPPRPQLLLGHVHCSAVPTPPWGSPNSPVSPQGTIPALSLIGHVVAAFVPTLILSLGVSVVEP